MDFRGRCEWKHGCDCQQFVLVASADNTISEKCHTCGHAKIWHQRLPKQQAVNYSTPAAPRAAWPAVESVASSSSGRFVEQLPAPSGEGVMSPEQQAAFEQMAEMPLPSKPTHPVVGTPSPSFGAAFCTPGSGPASSLRSPPFMTPTGGTDFPCACGCLPPATPCCLPLTSTPFCWSHVQEAPTFRSRPRSRPRI